MRESVVAQMAAPAPSAPLATRPLPAIDYGTVRDVQRSRELYKYYQPPPEAQTPRSIFAPTSNANVPKQNDLVSSLDPALSSFTLLTANLLSSKRSMISLLDSEMIYIIAESTRTLSITSPHTYEPGDQLWLGGCTSVPREGGLCERTVSLPKRAVGGNDEGVIFEVPDLRLEPFYKEADWVVNWPCLKFYAGTPLRTRNGHAIGSLCVVDDEPRPEGLREADKLTLAKMAETVMGHLERVQAERDMKRGRNMELGISRFLAGNFRLGRAELDDEMIHEGRIRAEEKQQEKKSMEAERLRWIGRQEQQKHDMEVIIAEGEVKTTTPSGQGAREFRRRKESNPFARDFATGLNRDLTIADDLWHETNEMGLTSVRASQLPLSFPSPVSEDFESTLYADAPLCLADPISIPELSRKFSYASVKSGRSATGTRPSGSITSNSSSSTTIPPSSPSDSLFHDSDFVPHCSAATTPTGQLQTTPSDVNSAFRSTFARASVLIRKSIEVDGVVFVDADLEDTYDIDDCMGPEDIPPQQSLGIDADFAKTSQRPKKYRRRFGILGFATKSGSSCSNPFNNDSIMCRRGSELERTLGFDIGEIDEPFLHHLATMWSQGRVFSCNHPRNSSNISPAALASESEDEGCTSGGTHCDEILTLKRFLPGAQSVVVMPLYDFSGKLFAVGFAWSCSKTRVFSEVAEKDHMAAFGNSIMAEVGRLYCVSADRAKGDFISSVSHELRSPLHGILASAEFLADTNLDSFQRSFVDTVESCGRTLLDTINHVLDFSKLNSFGNKWAVTKSSSKMESVVRRISRQRGRSDSVGSINQLGSKCDDDEFLAADSLPGPVNDVVHLTAETDLSAILEEVTEGVFAGYEFKGISTPGIMEVVGTPKHDTDGRPAVGTKNDITVIIDIDQHEDGWVFETQPGALRRIFLNLGGNAIKYTDSGWVRIRMKVEDLPLSGNEVDRRSLVKLIFTDSGKGISREFLKTRLFTPFSQENPLVSGTGLGMSIVRQIVEMLGGEIDVKSQVGKGTEVTVSLVLRRGFKSKPVQTSREKEICKKDAEIEDLRQRTKGKKVCLCGFESSPPESEAQIRAVSYMKNSFERYVTQWLGMEVVSCSLASADNDKVDLVITHEGPMVNSHLACTKKNGQNMAGKAGGPPLVVICSNAARHEIYQPLNHSEGRGIVDFVSKPCGPRKLAKALACCLDRVEAAPKTPVVAKPTVPTKTNSPISQAGGDKVVSGSNSFLRLTSGETTTSATTHKSVILFPSRKTTDEASVMPTILPTAMIPRTPNQSVVADSSVSQWEQEVERISSLSASEANKKLPSTLIVEDNPVNLMLLATFLKKKGYPFEKATNGLEAFQAVENRPEAFDIILMDLQMPVMSGIESTRAIRKLERQRQRKGSLIIALTGLATANDQLEAFEGGIDLFMVKPVSFKHLEKTLQEFKLEDQD